MYAIILKRLRPRIRLVPALALMGLAFLAVAPLPGESQSGASASTVGPVALRSASETLHAQPVPAPAAIDPTFDLCAKEGTITIAGAGTVDIWGFALKPDGVPCSDESVVAELPGPTLPVNEGDTVTVKLYNELSVNLSIVFPQVEMQPDTLGADPDGSTTYSFTADRPGTFLYEAGTVAQESGMGPSTCSDGTDNEPDSFTDGDDPECTSAGNSRVQVAMGLFGPLIVRPSFAGLLSLAVIGGRADVNGDGVIDGADDSNSFFGDTSIVDGGVDCDAGIGNQGDLTIDGDDDCTLTPISGPAISVVDGDFQVADGALAASFSVPDVTWQALNGRVDSNGNGAIDGDDCTFGLVGATDDVGGGDMTDGADVLGNPGANECGFASAPDPADNGLVDLNSDGTITSDDTCWDGCFFGHDLSHGVVHDTDTPFDTEAILVLSEVDPALNVAPDAFDWDGYNPKYWLINGEAYPDTSEIMADPADRVLFRYLNASLSQHVMSLGGFYQTVIAGDAYPLTFPYEVVSLTVASGQTFDTIGSVPGDAPSGTMYPLYSANQHVTNGSAFPGGMLTFVTVDGP